MINWIKEHPYLAGGLVLVVIVLIAILRKGSSASASQTATAATTDNTAALQANAAIQQMAYQAQTQVAGYNAQVNAVALQTAAQQNIAESQTGGAVQLGLAQSANQVAIASIAAGGIAPFSVAGTPGYNASQTPGSAVVGHAQVQAINAQDGAAVQSQIQQVAASTAQAVQTGTPIPTATPVTQPNGSTVTFTPSTPTSIGTGIAPGLPSPAGYATEGDYVAAVDRSGGINPSTAGLSSSLGNAPTIETLGNEAAAAWSSYYGAGGTLTQLQAQQNAELNQHAA